MKIAGSVSWMLPGIVTLFILAGCKERTGVELSSALFRNPPASASVHSWWHWMDNAITTEGITKDLEAMNKQGITTVTILNIGLLGEKNLGVPPVRFNTPEWYGMFQWALREADRLNMKVGLHNCDGWSSSGGPWITPETSMKRCTWSRSVIEGGQLVQLKLPEPHANLGFYRDINVLAFPQRNALSLFQKESPAVLVNDSLTGNCLYDANPLSMCRVISGTKIDIIFEKEFEAEKLAIHPRKEFEWGSLANIHFQFELKASDDGKLFRTVGRFDGPAMNRTSVLDLLPVKARYFRIEMKNITGTASEDLGLSEVELLSQQEKPAYATNIPFHLEKTITTMAGEMQQMLVEEGEPSHVVSLNDMIDLTAFMLPDGTLKWDAPRGDWEILRIGYTTTGAINGPATRAGTGLECDKMDTSAFNVHFTSFSEKMITHAGKYAGNTFEYLFIDSWECRYQNWTGNFPAAFEKRRNYSIDKWLPVVCGVEVESKEATERFLQDFRRTIAELIEENYYRHFRDLCNRHKMKSVAEVIYGWSGHPPLDILKSNSYMDAPMYEFWAGPDRETGFVKYRPAIRSNPEIPAQAGAVYGKQVIPAEAYTGYANFSETPWDLKLYGDRAFCAGINQMVLHSYVHQPFEKQPGVTLGDFGQSFNRHNPWWDFASQWFTYLARAQYVLQQGTAVADILYFTGDSYFEQLNPSADYVVPFGYAVQKCNFDILDNHCTVKDGKLHLDNGLSYEMLLVPDQSVMEFKILKKIAELVQKGAVVVGPRPLKVAGNLNSAENEKALNILSGEMWGSSEKESGENSYGKGKVVYGRSLKSILDRLAVKPDFSCDTAHAANLLYIHKRIGEAEVYFVVNQEDRSVERTCTFRIDGRIPEIWDPEYGTVSVPEQVHKSEGLTTVSLKFRPKESLFFVFRNKKQSDLKIRKELDDQYVITDFSGTLEFEDIPEKGPIPVTDFGSWTDSDDPAIKFYSGKATYRLHFDLPAEQAGIKTVCLSLDSVMAAHEITLNGKYLGCSTFPGHRFDVSGIVNEKGNKLEIRVANTWRNRIIGDFTEYGALKNCWTTSPVANLPGKDKPLQESGILGRMVLYNCLAVYFNPVQP